jgi:plastocyanin
MMRKIAIAAGSFLFLLSWALPAGAATRTVSAQDNFFSPEKIRVAQGTTVKWTNDGFSSHTSTQDDALDLWNSGALSHGATFDTTLASAGTFLYHCIFHGGNGGAGMSGSIKVPVKVSATSGVVGDTFTVTVATANAATGFVFDIQMKAGTGPWTKFKNGAKNRNQAFAPSAAGTYQFRSRLHRQSNGGVSQYSPPATITVAAS